MTQDNGVDTAEQLKRALGDVAIRHALIVIPNSRHAGFAITSLVDTFSRACESLLGTSGRLSVVYGDPREEATDAVQADLNGFPLLRPSSADVSRLSKAIRHHGIDLVLGLDLPSVSPIYSAFRAAGVATIVSYLGAPVSSINSGLRLMAKRAEILLRGRGPDHFVFETEAMRSTGTHGRGLPLERTSVVLLGADLARFHPDASDAFYAHDALGIPRERRLVFYSGHFEPRKGVAVLMQAAGVIANDMVRRDVHFVLLGNREGEAAPFQRMVEGTPAAGQVTFGGYRSDVPRLHRSCAVGAIGSTGWDSMTMSSVEMQASGLPLLVSRLQGLPESIEDGVTGYTFAVGNGAELAERILELVDDEPKRLRMAAAARARAERLLSRDRQVSQLSVILEQVHRRNLRAVVR
jgi:glycosyltransferase involved in cell wall biosynthesis